MPITPDQFSNYAASTIAGGAGGVGTSLLAADTSLLLQAGDGAKFPSTFPYMVQIGGAELVKVTARATDTLTIVRAQEGTAAATWAVGATVSLAVTAGSLQDLWSATALGIAQPREHSLVAWTFDPAHVSSGKAGIAGTVYLAAVYVPQAVSVTKIYWGNNTAGAGATASQNFVGLYNAAGTLLASAGVDASVTATGPVTTTIASTALTPGLYWVAFVFNATTMPQIYRGQDLNATLMNVGINTAASYRFATNGTLQTTLPASITPSANAVAQFCYWAAIG